MAVRQLNRLAAVSLKRLGPGLHPDGLGLYLQVGDSGSRSWIYRYNGRYMGLGALHTVTLAEAREKARKYRHQRLDGIDPIELRKVERAEQRLAAAKTMTFRACAE